MKKRSYTKGDRDIYEDIVEGLSFYQTPGEVYHTARSKAKFQQMYLESIKDLYSPRILDIGCFVGTELFMLPKLNPRAHYWGVDVSRPAIKRAQSLAKHRQEKNMIFQAIDANKRLPFSRNFFDVVYALELIEHLADPKKFLADVKHILKPGGCLILSTPNEGNIQNTIIRKLPSFLSRPLYISRESDFTRHGHKFSVTSEVWDEQAHISLWKYKMWKQIFLEAGFSLDRVEGSSAFGGSRYISDRPWLLGMSILADSVIDRLPFKPHLQMCLVVRLRKPL